MATIIRVIEPLSGYLLWGLDVGNSAASQKGDEKRGGLGKFLSARAPTEVDSLLCLGNLVSQSF
jgi:hypothetical protein